MKFLPHRTVVAVLGSEVPSAGQVQSFSISMPLGGTLKMAMPELIRLKL